jgi:hypothetical protein
VTDRFSYFADSVLEQAATAQATDYSYSVRLNDVLGELAFTGPEMWPEQVIGYLQGHGWVVDDSTMNERRLRITGGGFVRAEQVRVERKPLSLKQRASAFPWTTLWAFVAAVAALIAALPTLQGWLS